MQHELLVHDDADALTAAATSHVIEVARLAVADHGSFRFAVSGGGTPRAMFAELARSDLPWDATVIHQVDERIAPAGDPDRNLAHLTEALNAAPANVVPMPVEEPDIEAASDRYAASLPERFDLVHLGIGPDGHTASLVPDDAVLDVTDRLVAPTSTVYEGRRRMTLTYPGLGLAERLLWLVSGASKRDALARMLAGDQTIPAGRVTAAHSLVMTDRAAADSPP